MDHNHTKTTNAMRRAVANMLSYTSFSMIIYIHARHSARHKQVEATKGFTNSSTKNIVQSTHSKKAMMCNSTRTKQRSDAPIEKKMFKAHLLTKCNMKVQGKEMNLQQKLFKVHLVT